METQETLATINSIEAVATSETAQKNYGLAQAEPLDIDQSFSTESIIVGFTWVILVVISLVFWGSMVYAIAKLLPI